MQQKQTKQTNNHPRNVKSNNFPFHTLKTLTVVKIRL